MEEPREKKPVPIVTVTSKPYFEPTLTMVWSVMRHADPDRMYSFYLFHQDVPLGKQEQFTEWMTVWKNCEIVFVNVSEQTLPERCRDTAQRASLPCLGLAAPDLLPGYEKVLMLDADLIVCRDVGELFDLELDGKWLAAALDVDFSGQWGRKNREYRNYYTFGVPLKSPEQYIQSGVVVVDLQKIRDNFNPFQLFLAGMEGAFRYDDQDVWNLYCAGHIMILDQRWNVLHDNNGCRVRYVISFAPDQLREEYARAHKDPYIIHYAGCQKPWNDKGCDHADEYWQVAGSTPLAGELEKRYAQAERDGRAKRWARKVYHELILVCDKIRLR